MDNKLTGLTDEVVVGDRVIIMDKKFSGEAAEAAATVIEIREILGKKTYVVETEHGSRKVVGMSQVTKVTA